MLCTQDVFLARLKAQFEEKKGSVFLTLKRGAWCAECALARPFAVTVVRPLTPRPSQSSPGPARRTACTAPLTASVASTRRSCLQATPHASTRCACR